MPAPNSNINKVLLPISKAKGLANEYYIDDFIFEHEKQAVLFNNWSSIGFGSDVSNNGDVMPVNFAGIPLLIVRDSKGEINVFQNTCRHRGMILVQKPTTVNVAIRCPYHGWCYKLDGKLVATPMVGGVNVNKHKDIKYAELSLFKVRSYVWLDVIFVNITNKAPEFIDCQAEIMQRWSEFKTPIYHGGSSSSFEITINANWKLAVENYCESYHLPQVHPKLNKVSKIEDHYNIKMDNCFSGQGSLVYSKLKNKDGSSLPDFDGLCDKWDKGSEYIAIYPNTLLGVHREHIFSIVINPISVAKILERVSIYYAKDYKQILHLNSLIDANADFWKSVFLEDVYVVEGMQLGRYGPMFDGGKFSPIMDVATHSFHSWVANNLNNYKKS